MSNLNRRTFFKISAGTIIGVTAGSISLSALAAEQLKLDDPLAAAMRYSHKSEIADQNCNNCSLVQGEAGPEWRPCAIFPGKLVASEGWCAAWAKKAA
ncbi:high-potential iron sulfur protein 2 [Arsukibacterium sp. MJ3]|jgi:hypothetical protein|uniref:high-potential iron-sulfur protein n=1 Tax=Arsukibacterium sp. MJ3 TaxID=1632859 RepID=UPI0006270EC6|nr:high-potential iron-sulfur protein [Arsukibacterium sp. MJ3]KKO48268.1 high-potential iron sulfur protein 2 [Arsukibacterium sp. MJ3]